MTIGMRRLAIFDPANGRQPMRSPDGRYTLVFNGAIYNFRSLRTELAGRHWSFRTRCDTEVLLAAFVRWGEQCIPRLRGMFAFAVWDHVERRLSLARDPFGIKPLYYRLDGGRLIFASELSALVAGGIFEPEIETQSVVDYLGWLSVPAPRTIYRNIFSLRPGDFATIQEGKFSVRTAWTFASIPEVVNPCRIKGDFLEQLRGRLEDTVRAHTLSDVPVGSFLSGGVDSAAVTGLMMRTTSAPLRTFCVDFAESEYSEAAGAEASARHFGTVHRTVRISGTEVANELDRLLAAFDQPTGDGINTYYASKIAREGGVKVVLSGLGGDELFGGYPSFRDTPRLAEWLPFWRTLPRQIRDPIVARLRRGDTRRRKLADVLAFARDLHDLGSLQRRVLSDPARQALLLPEVNALLGGAGPFHPELAILRAELARTQPFDLVSAWETRTYMADVLLRDSDVMSMRHSLELRVPLVDRPLIEWLWRQPGEIKFDPLQPKSSLAEALADVLPPGTTERPKRGFSLPFDAWMKRELRPFLDETFSDASVTRAGLFQVEAVQAMWKGYLAGHDRREWSRVWSLAVLIAFLNRRSLGKVEVRPPVVPPLRLIPPEATRPRRPANQGRTLLLAPEIFSSEGGIPRILQTYLRALCDISGPSAPVRLLALNDFSIKPSSLSRAGINDRLEEWRGCGRNKSRFVREALAMSRGCSTIVCGHVAQLPIAWLAQRIRSSLKYYLIAHGIEVWRKFTPAERIALRGAELIFCVSDYTRRELLRNCPLPDGRAVVLPNALDPTFEIAAGTPLISCSPVILTVTRLTYDDRYKGVQHLIEAMPAIRTELPGATLRIVGRGDDLPRLQSLCLRLGVADGVYFTGYVDDDALSREFSNCRLFALPSCKEGFGLVFLEAMARGRPCLGARAGGIPEVISDETGLLVTYGNVPEIARACSDGLQRRWEEPAILAHARQFSYPAFRESLAQFLAARRTPRPSANAGAQPGRDRPAAGP